MFFNLDDYMEQFSGDVDENVVHIERDTDMMIGNYRVKFHAVNDGGKWTVTLNSYIGSKPIIITRIRETEIMAMESIMDAWNYTLKMHEESAQKFGIIQLFSSIDNKYHYIPIDWKGRIYLSGVAMKPYYKYTDTEISLLPTNYSGAKEHAPEGSTFIAEYEDYKEK